MIDQIRERILREWEQRLEVEVADFQAEDQAIIMAAAGDLAGLTLSALAGEDVEAEKAHAQAALASMGSAEAGRLYHAGKGFLEDVGRVLLEAFVAVVKAGAAAAVSGLLADIDD